MDTTKGKYIRFYVRLEALAEVAEEDGLDTVIFRASDGSIIFRAWRGSVWQVEYEFKKADILGASFDNGTPEVLNRMADAFFVELAKFVKMKGGENV